VITRRLPGASAVTTGENIETATTAPVAGSSSAWRMTMSEAIEWPSTASRPSLASSPRAKAATRPSSATSAAVAPVSAVTSPVSGAGFRPWPSAS
jgi:hypothetical protein